MMQEFEGKTEKEAIDNAINALGLNREEIDIEIVKNKKSFLFGGGKVKIKVHLSEEDDLTEVLEPEDDTEKKLIAFLSGIINRMNFEAQVSILFREENKLGLDIESENAAVMIGRQGKTLDAFQLLMNIYAGRIGNKRIKVVVDAEGYRQRR